MSMARSVFMILTWKYFLKDNLSKNASVLALIH